MNNEIIEHSLLKSVTLHLLPGLLVGACYFALSPLVAENGFPSVMSLILAGILVLIPFEMGFLLYQRRKTNQAFKNGVIRYFEKIPFWQYLILIPLIFIISGLLFKALNFTSEYLSGLFTWLPDEMLLNMGLDGGYEKNRLIITYGLFLILIVVILPTVEELYFRGFLLPRMPSRLKGWTILAHSGLFALYHIWTPWMFVVRTFGVLPLIYAVRRKRNLMIGIVSHILLNSVDFIIGLVYILSL